MKRAAVWWLRRANYGVAEQHLIKVAYEPQDKEFIYHLLFTHKLNPDAVADNDSCHSFITVSIPSSKRCHFSHLATLAPAPPIVFDSKITFWIMDRTSAGWAGTGRDVSNISDSGALSKALIHPPVQLLLSPGEEHVNSCWRCCEWWPACVRKGRHSFKFLDISVNILNLCQDNAFRFQATCMCSVYNRNKYKCMVWVSDVGQGLRINGSLKLSENHMYTETLFLLKMFLYL